MFSPLVDSPPREPMSAAEERAYAAALDARMHVLAFVGRELDLEQAQVLAFLRRQPLASRGWPSWSAFCREHVEWGETWIRQLIRLVESDLELVKSVVRSGQLPLYKAVRAPSEVERAGGEACWLAWKISGGKEERILIFSPEVEVVLAARERARLLAGQALGARAADAFVMSSYRSGRGGASLLRAARENPVVPEFGPLADCLYDAPSSGRCWRMPRDIDEALECLQLLQKERRARIAELGELYRLVRREWLWTMGYKSNAELAESLGLSLRSLQRYAQLVDSLEAYPSLQEAYERGVSLSRLLLVAAASGADTVDRWLAVAERTTVAELRHAVDRAATEGDAEVLAAYEEVMSTTTHPVAVRSPPAKPKVPKALTVAVGQVEAARWLLNAVRIPPRKGFGRVVDHDGHRCQNPRCYHRSLRVQAHHLVQVSAGGSDAPENLITVCPGCHLRGIHAGRIKVKRDGPNVLWKYADGVRIVMRG